MNLLGYLPLFYQGSREAAAIEGAMDPAVEAVWAARDGLFDQLHVETATWGLEAWERALGLAVDVSKDLEYRRTRVLSKLRGQGTTTVAMIRNVAESFSNGQVDVIEHPDAYRFEIKFTGTIGVPPNMDDLSAAIAEIKPAHLDYDYIIMFRIWREIADRTWGGLAARTWAEVKGGTIE